MREVLFLMCLVLCAKLCAAVREACYQPLQIGPCKASVNRFFYNISSCLCEAFGWGGCRPNENNFETLDECASTCGVQTQRKADCGVRPVEYSDCNLRKNKGICGNRYKRWYYDANSCTCKQFWYSGCGGNLNRFVQKEDCEASCGILPCSDWACTMSVKRGPCKAAKPRWYYDDKSRTCKEFLWGGCKANGNNFKSQKQCARKCM